MGTATTLSVIDAKTLYRRNDYSGESGFLGTDAQSLARRAAQLPNENQFGILGTKAEKVIGSNTVECMKRESSDYDACIDGLPLQHWERIEEKRQLLLRPGRLRSISFPFADVRLCLDENLLLERSKTHI